MASLGGRVSLSSLLSAVLIILALRTSCAAMSADIEAELAKRVSAAVNGSRFDDVSVFLGDASGEMLSYRKGGGAPEWEGVMPVASASKWVSAIILMHLVEDGFLSLDSRPAEVLPFWNASGPASRVTLAHLLAFTSGYQGNDESACVFVFGQPRSPLQCAPIIYAGFVNMTNEPGTVFAYYNDHLEVAAAMAEVVTGKSWDELYNEYLRSPLGLSEGSRFEGVGGVGGNLQISPQDYTTIMLTHALPPYDDGALSPESVILMNEDSTAPPQVQLNESRTFSGLFAADWPTWHYGFGHWIECPQGDGRWLPECTDNATGGVHSSIGAFGFYPIVDLAPREGFPDGLFMLVAPAVGALGEMPTDPLLNPMVMSLELRQALGDVVEEVLPLLDPIDVCVRDGGDDCSAGAPGTDQEDSSALGATASVWRWLLVCMMVAAHLLATER